MTATYTFDIFSTLDGFANHNGDWGSYWGKQGPESQAAPLGPGQLMHSPGRISRSATAERWLMKGLSAHRCKRVSVHATRDSLHAHAN